jgi:hypothetical protein
MAFSFGLERFAISVPFTASGKPATMRTTRLARAATRWLRMPCISRNRRPSGKLGTIPDPTSFATKTTGATAAARVFSSLSISFSISTSASMRFESQSVKQSTSTGVAPHAASAV